jgi:hypothetical protein
MFNFEQIDLEKFADYLVDQSPGREESWQFNGSANTTNTGFMLSIAWN